MGKTRSSLLITLCLCVAVVFSFIRVAGAQPSRDLAVPDDLSVLDVEPADDETSPEVSPAPTATLEIIGDSTAVPGNFGRTVVLVLAGVSWNEWLDLARPATPGFRKTLEEGALAAVRLPGGFSESEYSGSEYSGALVSPALLRAAGVLSSGRAPVAAHRFPDVAALTLGTQEEWSRAAPGWEDSAPAVAYARRTAQKPPPDALLNLGWGALQTQNRGVLSTQDGTLGHAVQAVGARAIALGSADTGLDATQTTLLREWALSITDRNGIVAGGDVSSALLMEDISAPYSVRTDADALLAAFDTAIADKRTAIIAVEWGDTRRAAMYAPLCSPSVAAAHKLDALTSADAWLQRILPRLTNERDRLLVLAVPDLNTSRAQWMPCAWWRPQRQGQGALLRVRNGGEAGIVPLEGLTSLLISRLPPSPSSDLEIQRLRTAYLFDETGPPLAAARRVGQLRALQSGMAWLDATRYNAQAIWAMLFVLALALSLMVLNRATPGVESTPPALMRRDADNYTALQRDLAARKRRRLSRLVRGVWMAAMTLPLAFWLVGLCLEVMRRLGAGVPVGGEGGWSWTAPLALGAVAILIVLVVISARAWFQKTRLSRTRIGLVWLALTVFGMWVGGFALPWNSLLGPSLLDVGGGLPPLTGDIWALWFISATLLGIAGLTRPPRTETTHEEAALEDEDTVSTPRASTQRRIINPRPAALWMLAVAILLLWAGWNRDLGGAIVGIAALGTMWLRLWLERSMPATRSSWRRGVLGVVVAFIVLLSLQRGGWVAVQSTLVVWWPQWLASWQAWWWNAALAATIIAAAAAATSLRPYLRSYFNTRYSSRLMLTAAVISGLVSLFVIGPAGPALLALYTLGAVFYEALAEPRVAA